MLKHIRETKPSMTEVSVYCALAEIQPLSGCEFNPSEIAGAMVRCYVPAPDAVRAVELLRIELSDMKMTLVETEWCVDYDKTEWENSGSQTETAYVDKARLSGRIIFDTFHTWGHDV